MTGDIPLLIGMTGASGVIYGKRLLEVLNTRETPTRLVMSRSAEITVGHETNFKTAAIKALATRVH